MSSGLVDIFCIEWSFGEHEGHLFKISIDSQDSSKYYYDQFECQLTNFEIVSFDHWNLSPTGRVVRPVIDV